MRIDRDDLDWAVREGILSDEQARTLWTRLQERTVDESSAWGTTTLDAATVAYYAGALVVIGAMGWFMTEALQQSEALLLPIALLYAAAFGGAGYWLRFRNERHIPGGLLFTIAVCMTPLAVYGLQHAVGLWPPDEDPSTYWAFYDAIGGRWVPMEVATILTGVLALRYVRFPPLVAPVAVASWLLSIDLAPLFFGAAADDWNQLTQTVSVVVGLGMLGVSFLVDRRTGGGYAFWGYLFGLFAFWGGLTSMDARSEWSRFGYFLINVGLIGVSVLLQRRVFLVFGALGAYGYLGYLSYDLFADSLWFPFALTALGASLIAGGVLYQRHRARIERAARSWIGLRR